MPCFSVLATKAASGGFAQVQRRAGRLARSTSAFWLAGVPSFSSAATAWALSSGVPSAASSESSARRRS